MAAQLQEILKANNLTISEFTIEEQNAAYGGAYFYVAEKSVRFRQGKVTPKKSGHFVAFWEKDSSQQNQAYDYATAPDLLVIQVEEGEHLGQFIFPREVLKAKGIYRTGTKKGKMGARFYPSWHQETSPQASKTQGWQSLYFIDLTKSYQSEQLGKMYTKSF